MINARAITINSVILFFMKFISMVKIYWSSGSIIIIAFYWYYIWRGFLLT